MGTEDRTPGPSGAGRARTGGDPPGMSEAEKRMAEWEARHDVAARGHRAPPDVLQHYVAHERLVHDHPAGVTRSTPPAAPPATASVEKPSRSLVGRLFRRH